MTKIREFVWQRRHQRRANDLGKICGHRGRCDAPRWQRCFNCLSISSRGSIDETQRGYAHRCNWSFTRPFNYSGEIAPTSTRSRARLDDPERARNRATRTDRSPCNVRTTEPSASGNTKWTVSVSPIFSLFHRR